nr:hypothetical protein HK105_007845 [Polyrhizophydium stewartii]
MKQVSPNCALEASIAAAWPDNLLCAASSKATSDMQEMGDFFLECVYEISGARQALLYYHQMAEDYVLAAQQADSLTTALEKLQAQASRTNSEDVVRKLSEAYYEQSTVAARVEDKACFLNYTSKRIVEEMDRFQAYHEALVDEQIQAHVKRQLEFESSLKLALQSALNQF